MTKEEKQLLLIDLCARLPYGVIVKENDGVNENDNKLLDIDMFDGCINYDYIIEDIKPYLRSMESMTDEEQRTLNSMCYGVEMVSRLSGLKMFNKAFDWLNENHFDYRGLIPIGLALEAPDGMYK